MRTWLLLLISPIALAQEIHYQGEISSGIRYDSQVGVTELDQQSLQGDSAWLVSGKVNASTKAYGADWSAGYQLQAQQYQHLREYDLQIHTGRLGYRGQFGAWQPAVQLYHANALLAHRSFLQMDVLHISAGRAFWQQGFAQFSWQGSQKRFANYSERNARNQTAGIDLFWFAPAQQWQFSFKSEHEQSDSVALSYQGLQARASLKQPFQAWGMDQQLQWQLQYQQKQYRADAESFRRHDERQQMSVRWQLNLSKALSVQPSLEYSHTRSNFAAAAVQETVSSLELNWQF